MNPRVVRYLQILLIALDLLAINLVFLVMFFLLRTFMSERLHPYYYLLGLYCSILWLAISFATDIYKGKCIFAIGAYFKKSVKGLFYFIVFIAAYFLWFRIDLGSRTYTTALILCFPCVIFTNRLLHLSVYSLLIKNKIFYHNVMVIGYNNLSKQLIKSLEDKTLNRKIIGICEERENVNELYHYPILSNIHNAVEVCKKYDVTEIYSSIAPEKNRSIYKLIQFADEHCIHFHIIPDVSLFINRKCHINYLNGLPMISLRHEPLEELSNRVKKKVFDLVFSFLVVVGILSWLIPVLGLLIRMESKGPIFFKQVRSGKNNKKFYCLKFRSMMINEMAHDQQATRNDQRLTRVGKFLRHTNLDEFPQFINVLKGDMSIVGPRPHMLKHTIKYSKMINQYMARHFLKPGITGWAQVYGYRGQIDTFEQLEGRVERDLWYLENWCLWLDVKIIAMTIFSTLRGDKNAY